MIRVATFAAAVRLRVKVQSLYAMHDQELPFHGWHHVDFVTRKACEFAPELGADLVVVEMASLVHDLNYLADTSSNASEGATLRKELLTAIGLPPTEVAAIESVVVNAETARRSASISPESKALSDGDTLYKALPITPVLLAPRYMAETDRSLRELAMRIVKSQVPLNAKGIYFYSQTGRENYQHWADANLELWRCLLESLDDPDVQNLMTALGN